jgi:urocanate hydratase
VINGGFGMVLDGTPESEARLKSMLFYDVNNGIARRSWARNPGAMTALKRELDRTPDLQVTLPNLVDDQLLDEILE